MIYALTWRGAADSADADAFTCAGPSIGSAPITVGKAHETASLARILNLAGGWTISHLS